MTREKLREVLAAYEPQVLDNADPSLYPAAVMVLIFEHEGEHHVVFQKRTSKVDAHKGEISFPGGGRDPEDDSLLAAALRETHEEIGVPPSDIDILGQLDELRTISNFRVTPFVGWLSHYPYQWVFNDDEVAYLLEVPIAHLRHPDTMRIDHRVVNGREVTLPSYPWQDDLIFGATARMLTNFLDIYAVAEG